MINDVISLNCLSYALLFKAILREHNIDADGDEEDTLENIRAELYGDDEEENEEEVTSEEEESFEQPEKPNQQNAVPTTSRR